MDDSVEDKGTETQSSNATFTEDLSNNLSLPPSNNTQRQYDTSSSSYNDVIGWNDATVTRSFDEIVEDFLQMLLETNLEELDSFEIRKFSLEIPRSYRPLRSNYSLIFEILFKIKDINNRAVFNDTLTFINKVFDGVDFNQFLLHFWQDLKRRNISPIGFSFTQGKPMFDYGDVNYNSIGQAIFGVKAIELAWSLLVDLDATMHYILDKCVYKHYLTIFHFCILRRLPCLGDFMVDDGLGKEIPIFLFYIELLLNDPKVQRNRDLYGSTLSLMVSVAWTPRRCHCSLISPNYILNKILTNLLFYNEFFPCWLKALKKLFCPPVNFSSVIVWKEITDEYDNPGRFLSAFVQCYHRNNSYKLNQNLQFVLEKFKEQMTYCRVPYGIHRFDEMIDCDYLFAYYSAEFLGISNFQHRIPKALYKALPPNCLEKYYPTESTEETLDQALIHIFELYFIVGLQLSKDFYENVWKTYSLPLSSIESVAKAMIEAYHNLKNSHIIFDRNLTKMVEKLCSGMDKTCFIAMSSFADMNPYFLFEFHHIFILSRAVRRIIENATYGRRKELCFNDLEPCIRDFFHIFVEAVTDKLNEVCDSNFNTLPPWRGEYETIMPDDKLMAIVHSLDLFQKDALCINYMLYENDKDIADFLFFLQKTRKVLGIDFTQDGQMRNLYENDQNYCNDYGRYSESFERSHNASTSQTYSQTRESYNYSNSRYLPSSTYQGSHHENWNYND